MLARLGLLILIAGLFLVAYLHSDRPKATSPDGRTCAAIQDDDRIKVWDAETGEEIETFDPAFPVGAIFFRLLFRT